MNNYKVVNAIIKVSKALDSIRKLAIAVMLICTVVKCLKLLKA